jgi:hypothetical protein
MGPEHAEQVGSRNGSMLNPAGDDVTISQELELARVRIAQKFESHLCSKSSAEPSIR